MEERSNIAGKTLYALLFLIVIPFGLWLWAKNTTHLELYPPIESPVAGWILLGTGGLLILWGMSSLMKFGKGLPMNAYPPPLLVSKGPYRLLRHPIYWGFGLFITGFFILMGMAEGLWLVTPITILGMIALVLGYERLDLNKRFPDQRLKTLLDLPDNNKGPVKTGRRLACLFWIVAMVLLGNFLVKELNGNISPYTGTSLDWFNSLSNPYMIIFSFGFVASTPFFLKRNDLLFEWSVSAIIGLALSIFIAMLAPAFGAQYLPPESINDSPSTGLYLTSVPILLVLISFKAGLRQSRFLGLIFGLLTILAIIIQLTFSRSAILHLTISILITLIAANYEAIWLFLRNLTEIIANSWKEWVFGKVRVINHGFYVGFGAFSGILLAGLLAGAAYAWGILVVTFVVIIFSALWAQIVDDTVKLKRPYGYYGALIGIIFASLVVWALGFNVWVLLGVISVFMPWVQAIGRLRCLINGCCHGAKIDNPRVGIRFFHHRSRVCWISDLKGELLHPTQLYAILWLFFVGFVLLAFWFNHFSSAFIFGLYLILTGLGRFVEEAYRGEILTPIIKGLRLYQWTALLSVAVGIVMTLIPVPPVIVTPEFGWAIIWAAIIGGAFTTFAMGIDFPYSNARFSRLV